LDTDISVFYLRGRYNLNQKLKEIIGYDNCFISEITLAELKYGAELSERVDENLRSVDEFSNKIGILPIFNSLDLYAKQKARLRKTGNMIDDFDLLIGCLRFAAKAVWPTQRLWSRHTPFPRHFTHNAPPTA
jgi:tRNA(fMet)-specific endonuclease VapC